MGSDADEKVYTTHLAKLQDEARRGRITWPIWVSVFCCLPLLVALAIFAVLVFANQDTTTGRLTLLHARGQSADLWLGFAGACAKARGSKLTCRLTPLNTYYASVYSLVHLEELEDSLPANLGFQSTVLLSALVLASLSVIFVLWGALDYHRAEKWQLAGMRGWVAEWLVSRRLDLLGTAFALGSLVCGVMAAAGTAVAVNSAATAINAVAPKTASEFSSAEAGFAPMALFLACALIALSALVELIVLAFDGLGHRIRKDYEDLVDDVEQLESEAWVSLEAKMHTLHQLATRHATSQALPDPAQRERARQALDAYLQACDVETLLVEMSDAVTRHRNELKAYTAQVDDLGQVAGPAAVTATATGPLRAALDGTTSTEASTSSYDPTPPFDARQSTYTTSSTSVPTMPVPMGAPRANQPGMPPLPAGLLASTAARPVGARIAGPGPPLRFGLPLTDSPIAANFEAPAAPSAGRGTPAPPLVPLWSTGALPGRGRGEREAYGEAL